MMSHGITGVTGFSNQIWLQSRALIEEGYEVYVIHRDYRGEPFSIPRGSDAKMNSGRPIDGLNILPIGSPNAQWGEDIFPYYINKYKPDYVHTLGDIWCYQFLRQIPRMHDWKWLSHYVFDTENVVSFWNECVRAGDITVVPSKNTFEMLKKAGHKNIKYVPHGIDTNIYKPATHEEKLQFRKEMGLPEDAFVIGCVAHNQYRKMMPRLLMAFESFVKNNPASILVFHCSPKDPAGWDLTQIIKDKNLTNNVVFTDKASKGLGDVQVPESELRKFYCSMDVHALSTGGEGFGVPIVEAMACGIPNVVTDYTTTKEFLCDEIEEDGKKKYMNTRGIAVPFVDIDIHHTGGIWAHINFAAMAQAFQYLKDNGGEGKQMGIKARKFAVENYDNELIKNKWKELYKDFDSFAEENKEKPNNGLRILRYNG